MTTPSLPDAIDRLAHLLSATRGIARALDPDPVMSEQDRVNLYFLTMLHAAQLERCRSRAVSAAQLEAIVWEDCRTFIHNPGEALAEARHQLHDRMSQVTRMNQERAQYMHALTEKTQERDRIMTLFRRGRSRLEDVEAQLDDIAREETELRSQLAAMDAQKAIAEAYEAHMMGASLLLHQLQDRLADIERTNDVAKKREIMELLVQGIRIDRKGARGWEATVVYYFRPERVANSSVR